MEKTYQMQAVELRLGIRLEDVIREQTEAGRTQEEIARYLGVSYWTYRSWLKHLGAEISVSVSFRPRVAAIP